MFTAKINIFTVIYALTMKGQEFDPKMGIMFKTSRFHQLIASSMDVWLQKVGHVFFDNILKVGLSLAPT